MIRWEEETDELVRMIEMKIGGGLEFFRIRCETTTVADSCRGRPDGRIKGRSGLGLP